MNMKLAQKNFSTLLKDYLTKRDHMISGFLKDGSARFVFSDVSQTLKDAKRRFSIYDPKKLEELGIAYNTASVMNSFLNGEERIKFLCQYIQNINKEESLLSSVYSESIGTGEVRGFVEESKVSNEVLNGNFTSFLKVSKILYNHDSEVYGLIKLNEADRLTEIDILKYFDESEQIKTHVFFNFKDLKDDLISQSFILQKMPDCDLLQLENNFYKIINNRNFKEMCQEGLSISKLQKIFNDLKLEVELRRTQIQFFCRCSKDQIMQLIIHLGKVEVEDMIHHNHNSINCKNCNTEYNLSEEDFKYMLEKISNNKI